MSAPSYVGWEWTTSRGWRKVCVGATVQACADWIAQRRWHRLRPKGEYSDFVSLPHGVHPTKPPANPTEPDCA